MSRLLTAALLAALCASAAAKPHERVLHGTVTHVSDGDTVWVRIAADKRPVKLRLAGIDAPERCQAHGEASRAALQARLMGQAVAAFTQAVDMHGRVVARVQERDTDVAAWLVSQGHAWSPGYRGRPGPYARQEASARRGRKGLFADPAAEPPREFRRRHGPCPR